MGWADSRSFDRAPTCIVIVLLELTPRFRIIRELYSNRRIRIILRVSLYFCDLCSFRF